MATRTPIRAGGSRLLVAAYLLYAVSFVLPAVAMDVGSSSGDPSPGWAVFVWGPVAAYMGIQEPGAQQWLAFVAAYYLLAWTANCAMLLPLAGKIGREKQKLAACVFAFFAWSVLLCFLVLPKSLIHEVSIGYFTWAVAVSLVWPAIRARAGR